jgi:chromosomal replication initiator protein
MNEMIAAIRADRHHDFRARYRSTDILIVDDIQLLGNKERTQEEFFHVFNDLHDNLKQIVITSDSPPKEIPGLSDRLRMRFEWGVLAEIKPPDYETKLKILALKAAEEGIALPDDVACFIAEKTKSNVRELQGCLIKLIAYSSITGTPINLEMAFSVLGHIVRTDERKATVQTIQRMVADRFGLKTAELKQKDSSKRIAFPRMVAMYLVKQLTDASLPEIARAFGGKHHTTVIHAIRRIEVLRQTDADLNRLLHGLEDSLG